MKVDFQKADLVFLSSAVRRFFGGLFSLLCFLCVTSCLVDTFAAGTGHPSSETSEALSRSSVVSNEVKGEENGPAGRVQKLLKEKSNGNSKNKNLFQKTMTSPEESFSEKGKDSVIGFGSRPEIRVLKNGLKIIFFKSTQLPLVDYTFVAQAGFRDDFKGKSGTAEVLSSLIERGGGHPNFKPALEKLVSLGITASASLDENTISLTLHGLSRYGDQMARSLGEIVQGTEFSKERVAKEVTRVRDRWDHFEEYGDMIGHFLLKRRLAAGTSYGRGSLSSIEELTKIENRDIRNFYEKYFRPDNSVLLVVGNADSSRLYHQIEDAWGAWEKKASSNKKPGQTQEEAKTKYESFGRKLSAQLARSKEPIFIVEKLGVSQTEVHIGITAPRATSESLPGLLLVNTVLGAGYLNRLNSELRDRLALTFMIDSSLLYNRDQSELVIHALVPNEKVGQLRAGVQKLLTSFESISEEELARAKRSFIGQLAVSTPSVNHLAGRWLRGYLFGMGSDHLDQLKQSILALTLKEVNFAAQRLLSPAQMATLSTVLVGDPDIIEESIRFPKAAGSDEKIIRLTLKDLI